MFRIWGNSESRSACSLSLACFPAVKHDLVGIEKLPGKAVFPKSLVEAYVLTGRPGIASSRPDRLYSIDGHASKSRPHWVTLIAATKAKLVHIRYGLWRCLTDFAPGPGVVKGGSADGAPWAVARIPLLAMTSQSL